MGLKSVAYGLFSQLSENITSEDANWSQPEVALWSRGPSRWGPLSPCQSPTPCHRLSPEATSIWPECVGSVQHLFVPSWPLLTSCQPWPSSSPPCRTKTPRCPWRTQPKSLSCKSRSTRSQHSTRPRSSGLHLWLGRNVLQSSPLIHLLTFSFEDLLPNLNRSMLSPWAPLASAPQRHASCRGTWANTSPPSSSAACRWAWGSS